MTPQGRSPSKQIELAPMILGWPRGAFPGAFTNSANDLVKRAHRRKGEEGDRLFARACNRFRNLQRINPTYVPALKLWGAALANWAPTLRGSEVERIRAEAEEKLSLALALAPNDVGILIDLASVLERRAWTKPPDVAGPLLARAGDLVTRGLSLQPDNPHVLLIWAFVLYAEAHAFPGEAIDRRLAQALDTFKSAYRHPATVSGWGTILFALAHRTSGADAERLLRETKEKYAEALAHDPATSTCNLACVCARLGEVDECRQWLERSGEPGRLATREELIADPELAAVRDCEWFRSLVAE